MNDWMREKKRWHNWNNEILVSSENAIFEELSPEYNPLRSDHHDKIYVFMLISHRNWSFVFSFVTDQFIHFLTRLNFCFKISKQLDDLGNFLNYYGTLQCFIICNIRYMSSAGNFFVSFIYFSCSYLSNY